MVPLGGLLGMLGKAGAAGTTAFITGSEFPLYGLLGMMMGNRYAKYAVPESEPGYYVKARLMHFGDGPVLDTLEQFGHGLPGLRHYQFIGEKDDDKKGVNRGFGPKGEFSDPPDVLPEYTLDNPFGGVRYPAWLVEKGIAERQKAIEAIRTMKMENPDMYGELDDADLGDYEFLMNNCHDYIADVLWRGAGYSGR